MVRYFALREGGPNGRETAVFTGRSPRQAALKAASRGKADIYLRERGTDRVHHYKGERKKVRAPDNKPDWMPEMVWKPNVSKVGLTHLKAERKAKKAKKARRARRARRR
jgi:hypothetical protein